MMFVINSMNLLDDFKRDMSRNFDIKFLGAISSFIGWDIRRSSHGIEFSQERYMKELLNNHGLHSGNGTWTPVPTNCDIRPTQPN